MTAEEAEQHQIATGILLGLTRLLIEKPGIFEAEMAGTFLLSAAAERQRQGDYGAARLLEEWADDVTRGAQ